MARGFSATTDKISMASVFTTTTANVTVMGWAYSISAATPAYPCLFHNGNNNAVHNGYGIYLSNGGNGNVTLNIPTLGLFDTGTTFPLNGWHQILIQSDGFSHFTVYLDNTSILVDTHAPATPAANAGVGAGIGWDTSSSTAPSGGRVAEIACWTVGLTALERLALFNGTRANRIRPASLVFWMPCAGDASPEPDYSLNVNNGTLTGTTYAFGPPLLPLTLRWPQLMTPPPPPPPPPILLGQQCL
jgi:hypothetical protein